MLRIIALFLLSFGAHAALLPFQFYLNVTKVNIGDGCASVFGRTFGCEIAPMYHGYFFMDESVLTQEGLDLKAEPFAFSLVIGAQVWDQTRDQRQGGMFSFRGSHNEGFHSGPPQYVGIDVADGVLLGIRGSAEIDGGKWIDFDPAEWFPDGLYHFDARDDGGTLISGTVTILQAPEPGTLALLGLLLMVPLMRRNHVSMPV